MSSIVFDISPKISARTAVFPGDQPFTRAASLSFASGDHLELSSIKTTLHIGAHADAPSHYTAGGAPIDRRSLHYYMGPCQVVQWAEPVVGRITLKHWGDRSVLAPRVLFATRSFLNPDQWSNEFASLSPELINYLAEREVITVGIDTPSIDPAEAKDLISHQAVAANDMAILEGLILKSVPEGVYDLIALPLKIEGADASPVRAILVADGNYSKTPVAP